MLRLLQLSNNIHLLHLFSASVQATGWRVPRSLASPANMRWPSSPTVKPCSSSVGSRRGDAPESGAGASVSPTDHRFGTCPIGGAATATPAFCLAPGILPGGPRAHRGDMRRMKLLQALA
jgi:hypothetical protein